MDYHRANIILETGCPGGFPCEHSRTGSPQRGQGGLPGAAAHRSLSSGRPISEETTALSGFLWSATDHGPGATQWDWGGQRRGHQHYMCFSCMPKKQRRHALLFFFALWKQDIQDRTNKPRTGENEKTSRSEVCLSFVQTPSAVLASASGIFLCHFKESLWQRHS